MPTFLTKIILSGRTESSSSIFNSKVGQERLGIILNFLELNIQVSWTEGNDMVEIEHILFKVNRDYMNVKEIKTKLI